MRKKGPVSEKEGPLLRGAPGSAAVAAGAVGARAAVAQSICVQLCRDLLPRALGILLRGVYGTSLPCVRDTSLHCRLIDICIEAHAE